MDRRIVLATGNLGKLVEMQALLQDTVWDIVPQSDFDVDNAEETGLTFVENALIKARHACALTGLPGIADDSGLEVAALDGAPGIYSARYAGQDATDGDNIDKLLSALSDIPAKARQARFRSVIVFLRHAADPAPVICEGVWEGAIGFEAVGTSGFGYDPVFYVPEYECRAAELTAEQKNRISHRGMALGKLKQWFAANPNSINR